jgi:hypothetical protein
MFRQSGEKNPGQNENKVTVGARAHSRRDMIRNMLVIPFLGIPFFGNLKKNRSLSINVIDKKSEPADKSYNISDLKGEIPRGKIKNLEISRMIAGGNQVSGIVASPDVLYLTDLIKNYYTQEKAIEYLGLCEASGINTAILRCDDHILGILKEYWRRGGKIQWLAQTYPEKEDMTNIKIAIDAGASGAFVMGGVAEDLLADNRLDCLAKDIEYIRSRGLIAGTAAHKIEVPLACVKNGIFPDFYMKTFHHLNYPMAQSSCDKISAWEKNPDEVSDFFKTSQVPWIAYKVLAKGAIKPESALKYAFEKGADFACVGMFDFQVVENVNTMCKVLESGLQRERKWYS